MKYSKSLQVVEWLRLSGQQWSKKSCLISCSIISILLLDKSHDLPTALNYKLMKIWQSAGCSSNNWAANLSACVVVIWLDYEDLPNLPRMKIISMYSGGFLFSHSFSASSRDTKVLVFRKWRKSLSWTWSDDVEEEEEGKEEEGSEAECLLLGLESPLPFTISSLVWRERLPLSFLQSTLCGLLNAGAYFAYRDVCSVWYSENSWSVLYCSGILVKRVCKYLRKGDSGSGSGRECSYKYNKLGGQHRKLSVNSPGYDRAEQGEGLCKLFGGMKLEIITENNSNRYR